VKSYIALALRWLHSLSCGFETVIVAGACHREVLSCFGELRGAHAISRLSSKIGVPPFDLLNTLQFSLQNSLQCSLHT
jgi:hypothetical protein